MRLILFFFLQYFGNFAACFCRMVGGHLWSFFGHFLKFSFDFFFYSLVFSQHAVVSFYRALLGSFWPKVMVMHWAAQGYDNNT